jgi:C4-type Zn-finger protein
MPDEPQRSDVLTDEEWELFQAHIHRFPKAEVCPVCDSTVWSVTGLEMGTPVVDDGVHTGGVQVVTLICKTCFYVRRFAWLGIKREAAAAAMTGGRRG